MCWNDFGIKVVFYDLGWPLKSYFILWILYNVDILKKFLRDLALNNFEIFRWPFVTFNDPWSHLLFNETFESLQSYVLNKVRTCIQIFNYVYRKKLNYNLASKTRRKKRDQLFLNIKKYMTNTFNFLTLLKGTKFD